MHANDDIGYASSHLRSMGIKHGVRVVSRAHFIDEDGDLREDRMVFAEDRRHSSLAWQQNGARLMIWLRCMPPDPEDMFAIKNWLLWMQWLSMACDLAAAIVALVTFDEVTECCGKPILSMAGELPWQQITRSLTIIYVVLVCLEVYPVVRRGFPFNIVNPILGFTITFAMFFDDSLAEALIMWAVESAAVICEFTLFRLKVRQITLNERELKRIGALTKAPRELRDGEDPDAPQRELTEMRQKFYQLKQEQVTDHSLVWYLTVGCYINIFLSLVVLLLVVFISRDGGICIDNFQVPNPFASNQNSRCNLCSNVTEGICEVCSENYKQCYYPYS